MLINQLTSAKVASLFILIAASRILFIHHFPVYDDAFITFRYAENLIDIGQYVYNENDWVLGTTTPLFGLLVSLIYFLGMAPDAITPFFNATLDIAICATILLILKNNENYYTAISFLILYAISPILGRITAGGMEANTFALVSLASLALYQYRYTTLSVIIGSLAFFIRPEAAVTVGTILLLYYIDTRSLKNASKLALYSLIIPLTGMLILYLLYGQAIPQSVVAKSEVSHIGLLPLLKEFFAPDPLTLMLAPLAIWGGVIGLKSGNPARIIVAWALLYLIFYALRGPKMWSWYVFPFQVGYLICAAIAMNRIIKYMTAKKYRITEYFHSAALFFGIMAVSLEFLYLKPETISKNIYDEIKNTCETFIPEDTVILASDIGIIGYACKQSRIIDSEGLVSKNVIQLHQEQLIEKYHPDYVFLTASFLNYHNFIHSNPAGNYAAIARYAKSGEKDLSFKKESFSSHEGWTQEYILFERSKS